MQERERFSGLKFRVDRKYDQPLDRVFPELFSHPEFDKLMSLGAWQPITRYICLLYDYKSDLIHEHPSDLKARKEAAAIEAGFHRDDKTGKFSDEVESIMDVKHKEAYEAIIAFLKLLKHQTWTEIVVSEQELWDFQKLRFKPIDQKDNDDIYGDAKKKDILLDASEKRRKHLETLYKEFYGDNKDVQEAEFEEQIRPETAERIMWAARPQHETATSDVPV